MSHFFENRWQPAGRLGRICRGLRIIRADLATTSVGRPSSGGRHVQAAAGHLLLGICAAALGDAIGRAPWPAAWALAAWWGAMGAASALVVVWLAFWKERKDFLSSGPGRRGARSLDWAEDAGCECLGLVIGWAWICGPWWSVLALLFVAALLIFGAGSLWVTGSQDASA